MLKDRRVVLLILVLVVVAGMFWSGSRVPALNEKALMGGDTQLDAIGFEIVIEVQPDDPLPRRVLGTTVNWMRTNLKGMTFGIVFATILMTLLSLLKKRSFDSGFGNTLLGMTIGAPLGVCVNCAAPIAQGLRSGGAQVQTMLAAMISSPTLNIIVLTMLFSLFPLWMVAIKLGLTLLFILICIPLLVRFMASDAQMELSDAACAIPLATASGEVDGWGQAAVWTVRNLGKNLWFILKSTVPLMILAGFLGSLIVTAVPLDSIAGILPSESIVAMILAMLLLSFVGLMLPVPIAFDVIVVAVLMSAGLPAKYAMILLFTLGVFSMYALFIAWNAVPKTVAIGVTVVLWGLGFVAGVLGDVAFDWNLARQREHYFAVFDSDAVVDGPTVLRVGGEGRRFAGGELVAGLRRDSLVADAFETQGADGVVVERIANRPPVGDAAEPFTRFEGKEFGLDEPYSYSVLNFVELIRYQGVATGDVHNDGWVDVLLTSDQGVTLYASQQGSGFVVQPIGVDNLGEFRVVNAALVDLDDDGWLDIFFATHRKGNWVIHSHEGDFSASSLQSIPNQADALMTASASFGDPDRDGDLDLALGNWSLGIFARGKSLPTSRNIYVENRGENFRPALLEGTVGETLTTMFLDLDGDGDLDLFSGNDFKQPDDYFLGSGDGLFELVARDDGIVPHSSETTMSITTGDIDNDLQPEIYLAQIVKGSGGGSSALRMREIDTSVCGEIVDAEYKRACESVMSIQGQILNSRDRQAVARCSELEGSYEDDCVAVHLLWSAVWWTPDKELCDLFPASWQSYADACSGRVEGASATADASDRKPIPQVSSSNVLLARNEEGRFVDRADALGVATAGWAWNAKFADLDNDEWQDLYVVNGQLMQRFRESNIFFHNQGGKGFTDATDRFGLKSFLSTGAYSYVDLDNDGDLDIITRPAAGPLLVYRNNVKGAHSIAFAVRDEIGNRFGIGTKVTIHYGPDGSRHQMRDINAGGGFISFDEPVATFGLGEFDRVSRVEIVWSTGERSELRGDFTAGARYVIRRPQVAVATSVSAR